MASQHVKRSETLLKSSRQYLCHIFGSLWKEVRSRYSALVLSEILRGFLTYWHPMKAIMSQKKRVSNATNSNEIFSKSKNIFWFYYCISEIYIKFETLSKKLRPSSAISFWTYRLQIVGLLKCIKSPVSEHLGKVNMLKSPKDFLNLHRSFFVIFFDHS